MDNTHLGHSCFGTLNQSDFNSTVLFQNIHLCWLPGILPVN
jgi:hypothetical protein